MRIDILTVVPQLLEGPFSHSILKRAQDKGLTEIHVHNIRDYSLQKQKQVDDYQYGGGAGMVMRVEPIAACIEKLKAENKNLTIVLTFFSPSGYEACKNYKEADAIFYLPMDGKKNAQQFK